MMVRSRRLAAVGAAAVAAFALAASPALAHFCSKSGWSDSALAHGGEVAVVADRGRVEGFVAGAAAEGEICAAGRRQPRRADRLAARGHALHGPRPARRRHAEERQGLDPGALRLSRLRDGVRSLRTVDAGHGGGGRRRPPLSTRERRGSRRASARRARRRAVRGVRPSVVHRPSAVRRRSAATSVRRGTFVASVRPCTPESVGLRAASGRSSDSSSPQRRKSERGVALRLPWCPTLWRSTRVSSRRSDALSGEPPSAPRPVLDLRVAGGRSRLSPASSMRITLVLLSASSTVRTIRSSDASCWRSSRSTSQATGSGTERGPPPRLRPAGRLPSSCASLCQPVLGIGRALARQLAGTCSTVGGPRTRTVTRGRAPRSASRCPRQVDPPRSSPSARGCRSQRGSAADRRRAPRARRAAPTRSHRQRRRQDRRTPVPPRAPQRTDASRSRPAGARASSGSFGWSVQGRTTSPGSSLGRWLAVTGSRIRRCDPCAGGWHERRAGRSCVLDQGRRRAAAAGGRGRLVDLKSNRMCRSARRRRACGGSGSDEETVAETDLVHAHANVRRPDVGAGPLPVLPGRVFGWWNSAKASRAARRARSRGASACRSRAGRGSRAVGSAGPSRRWFLRWWSFAIPNWSKIRVPPPPSCTSSSFDPVEIAGRSDAQPARLRCGQVQRLHVVGDDLVDDEPVRPDRSDGRTASTPVGSHARSRAAPRSARRSETSSGRSAARRSSGPRRAAARRRGRRSARQGGPMPRRRTPPRPNVR